MSASWTAPANSSAPLFTVPLEGGAEREIKIDPSQPLMGTWWLSPNSVSADGRLLFLVQPLDSWFSPIGLIDTATGRVTRVVSERLLLPGLAAGRPNSGATSRPAVHSVEVQPRK
jgi:hypothetical protein